MKRKILLTMATLMATAAVYGAGTVDINIGARLITPLTMTKSSDNLVGQVLSNTNGDFSLTPINISFAGSNNASVTLVTDQYVDLTNGGSTIRMSTGLIGGTVTSNGTDIQSEMILSSSGTGNLEMGGMVTLAGSEASGNYIGTANIQVDYN